MSGIVVNKTKTYTCGDYGPYILIYIYVPRNTALNQLVYEAVILQGCNTRTHGGYVSFQGNIKFTYKLNNWIIGLIRRWLGLIISAIGI